MTDSQNNKKGKIHTTMSCEAIQSLIRKRKEQQLNFRERSAVIGHCFSCRECLKMNKNVLDGLVEKLQKEKKSNN